MLAADYDRMFGDDATAARRNCRHPRRLGGTG